MDKIQQLPFHSFLGRSARGNASAYFRDPDVKPCVQSQDNAFRDSSFSRLQLRLESSQKIPFVIPAMLYLQLNLYILITLKVRD